MCMYVHYMRVYIYIYIYIHTYIYIYIYTHKYTHILVCSCALLFMLCSFRRATTPPRIFRARVMLSCQQPTFQKLAYNQRLSYFNVKCFSVLQVFSCLRCRLLK